MAQLLHTCTCTCTYLMTGVSVLCLLCKLACYINEIYMSLNDYMSVDMETVITCCMNYSLLTWTHPIEPP